MDANRLSFAHALPWAPQAVLRAGARAFLSRLRRHTHALEKLPDASEGALSVPPFGRVAYYTNAHRAACAAGRPLLLLHGMNMRADAREIAPLFEAFSASRSVYAPDLPGFGASQPGAAPCHPELYVNTIKQLIELSGGDALAPVDVVALGLSCEHAARTVAALPDMVHSLVLIAPSGFACERDETVLERAARGGRTVLPVRVLRRLGLARLSSAGFAAVLGGNAFPKENPQAAYTRVHCPTLVLHERTRRARYGTLSRFVRWREHYQDAELTSLRLAEHEVRAEVVSALSRFFDPPTAEQATALELRAG